MIFFEYDDRIWLLYLEATEESGTIEQSEAVEEAAEEPEVEKEAEPAVEAAKPCALFASKSRLNTLVCSSLADFS